MITFFTPTYNRAEHLRRLYQSLVTQESHDFEWLVIDDGSTDGTGILIEELKKTAPFSMRYERQENGGKHRAYNRALTLALGDWFVCIDSDDWLTHSAIEALDGGLRNKCAQIVVAYKSNERNELLSDPLPANNGMTSLHSLLFDQGLRGEFTLIFRTNYARRFPFPTFPGERFLTESVAYDRMANDKTVSLLPATITMCEYQEDGLSSSLNRLMRENPAGFCLYFMQRIDLQAGLLQRVVTAGKYHAFCRFAGAKRTEYQGKHPMAVKMSSLIGMVFWLYYKFFRGF